MLNKNITIFPMQDDVKYLYPGILSWVLCVVAHTNNSGILMEKRLKTLTSKSFTSRLLIFAGLLLSALLLTIGIATSVYAQSGEDFTIIVLPDTQYSSMSYPHIYLAQTQWIIDNKDALNIVYVAHEGDIVENSDQTAEWENADAAMSLLEDPVETGLQDGLPYGVIPGNHDQPSTLYNQYFGVSRFQGRSYYGGHYSPTDNDNNFTLFSAGGMDFIVINIAYGLDKDPNVLVWADQLLKDWSERQAIVVSHSLLYNGNPAEFNGQGNQAYNALKDNPNLFLMLCGHNYTEGINTSEYNGNTTYTLLANYQILYEGDGWLRIMRFSPAAGEITVTTYSPLYDIYGTDPVSTMGSYTTSEEFILPYAMDGGPTYPPTAPTALNVTAVTPTQIDLDWTDNSDNEAGLQIERSSDDGTTFDLLATVHPDSVAYTDTGLSPETNYCYRVRAVNSVGQSAYTPIECDNTWPGQTVVTFMQGIDGYVDTIDTRIQELNSDLQYGDSNMTGWDGDYYGTEEYALIRFDNIFGASNGQIPVGATIHSATLTYVVDNLGHPADCNEVTADWQEDVTYNTFGGDAGVQADEYGTFVGSAAGSIGAHVIDVTTSLSAWSANPLDNRGWIFRPTSTNGVEIFTSEYGTISSRPSLTVEYTPPAP